MSVMSGLTSNTCGPCLFLSASAARLRAGGGNPTLVHAPPPVADDGLPPIRFDTEGGAAAVDTADSEADALQRKEDEARAHELLRLEDARRAADASEAEAMQSMQSVIPTAGENTSAGRSEEEVDVDADADADADESAVPWSASSSSSSSSSSSEKLSDVVATAAEAAARVVLAHYHKIQGGEEDEDEDVSGDSSSRRKSAASSSPEDIGHNEYDSVHSGHDRGGGRKSATEVMQDLHKFAAATTKKRLQTAYMKPMVDYAAHGSHSAQEYDPFPTENELCPVSTLTVKHDARLEASAAVPPPSALTTPGGGPSPKDIAVHLARYTGIWDMHIAAQAASSGGVAQGQLYAPSRLPFVAVGKHFFADVDGRINFAAMGTPGGDMGEFILGLCALEAARVESVAEGDVRGGGGGLGDEAGQIGQHYSHGHNRHPRGHQSTRHHHDRHSAHYYRDRQLRRMKQQRLTPGLNLPDVRSLLKGWLSTLASTSEGHRKFYMQTDHEALQRLEKFVNASDGELLRDASDFNQRVRESRELQQLVTAAAALPEHVGSLHLRLMLQGGGEGPLGKAQNGGCRPELAEYAITAYWEIMLKGASHPGEYDDALSTQTDADAMAGMLTYHVVEGYHQEAAAVSVYAMEGECTDVVPLVVPGVRSDADAGDSKVLQVAVTHPSAVQAYRSELAEFMEMSVREDGEEEEEEEDEDSRGGDEDEDGNVGDISLRPGEVLAQMNLIGGRQLERVLTALTPGKPRYAAFFTENPF
jgi:hypothetical protein